MFVNSFNILVNSESYYITEPYHCDVIVKPYSGRFFASYCVRGCVFILIGFLPSQVMPSCLTFRLPLISCEF
jgi:hypothetical protein